MTKTELQAGIAAMQRIQATNPPSSVKWNRASKALHELVRQLTGKYPSDGRKKTKS